MNNIPEEIIIRSIQNTATTEELTILKEWLEEDNRNVSLYFQLEELWSHGKPVSKETIQNGWEMLERQIEKRTSNLSFKKQISKTIIPGWLHYVAAVFVGVIISTAAWYLLSDSMKVVDTQLYTKNIVHNNNGVQSLILPDGSQVWLNENSRITYPDEFADGKRMVALTGNAYFDVSKDMYRPFIVESGDIEIEVTGTEFFVELLSEHRSAVTLITGGVNVSLNDVNGKQQFTQLSPGQQASVSGINGDIVVEQVNTDYYISWKDGTYRFTDEKLEKIASIIGKRYGLNIHVASDVKDRRFTGRVASNEKIEDVMKSIQRSYPVKYRISDKNIYLAK